MDKFSCFYFVQFKRSHDSVGRCTVCMLLLRILLLAIFPVEQPGNCLGDVSCSVIPTNEEFPLITVSVVNPLSDLICAKEYEFRLGDQVMQTNETSVTFTYTTLGMEYMNQPIYTLNDEGRKGAIPCTYSITGRWTAFIH